jgi:23S rRNA (guanosine2251-2'-O)-methyltransferase
MLTISNPHSLRAAILTRAEDVKSVYVPPRPSDAWQKVIEACDDFGVSISVATGSAPQKPGSQRTGKRPGHRGRKEGSRGSRGYGLVDPRPPVLLEQLFEVEEPAQGVWLALDCIQDPHNVGAIFRAAGFFNVKGIILTKDRSSPMTEVVYDISSGGVEYVPYSIEVNLSRVLDIAKQNSLWVLGTSEHADMKLDDVDTDRAWLCVMGNEEKGLRRLTIDKCDEICSIPSYGEVGSLNVSVAAGILMHHFAAR